MYRLALSLLLAMLPALASEPGPLPDARDIARVQARHGPAAAARLLAWRNLTLALAALPENRQIQAVNDFFNNVPGVSDEALWGQRDYWATPIEMLVADGGDCEDYSLAKYFTLRALGVANDKLRITYVRAWLPRERRMESHMVLAYYPAADAEPLILDNLLGEVRPASSRTDLVPTMSFNAEGLWSAKLRGQRSLIGKPGDIARWSDLLSRMAGEP